MNITLQQADRVIAGALAEARARQAQPLAVIVLDSGAHPVAFRREDGASFFRLDIARAKATGALGMGIDTRELAQRAVANPTFFGSVVAVTGGNMALSPGGMLIRDSEGIVIGAVGISGDTGDVDESCAIAAIDTAFNRQSGSTSRGENS